MTRKTATVLFADVKGYSDLTESNLDVFHSRVLPGAASRLDGLAIEYCNTWGDGIVVACSDVRDACKAALELRDYLKNYDWDQLGLPPLSARISLHSGTYFTGSDRFTDRGSVWGRTIIQAARIEPITKPGRVWVTSTVRAMLEDSERRAKNRLFELDEIGEVTLPKGAGQECISVLRRIGEPKTEKAEIDEVISAAAHRNNVLTAKVQRQLDSRNFEVVVSVVVRGSEVLLVRRQRDGSGLDWMFPSGKKLSVDDEKAVAFKEVMAETAISCKVMSKIGTIEVHPITQARCHYYHLIPVDDQVTPWNKDPSENRDVRFVPIRDLRSYIPEIPLQDVVDFLDKYAID